jgi:hypothetical protein
VARKRRSSIFAIGVAGALLLAQVAGLAHLLVVEHERCAEHGDIVEGAANHPAAAAAERQEGDRASVRAAGDEIAGHDHCLYLATLRRGTGSECQHVVLAPRAAAARFVVGAERREQASGPSLLRIAPKTSPPALG